MRVVFDPQIFAAHRFGGIARYFVELAREFRRMPGVEPVLPLGFYENEYVGEILGDGVVTGWARKRRAFRGVMAVNRLGWHLGGWGRGAEIYHPTYYFPMPRPRGARMVATFYDMIHERFWGHLRSSDRLRARKRRLAARADRILSISETTKRDLVEDYGVDPARIDVVHLAVGDAFTSADLPREPQVLYVGKRGGYKNFEQLRRAFEVDAALRRELKLVLFGGGRPSPDELPRDARVEWLDGDDRVLVDLYRRSAALVYPSTYEGFGIPVLEAHRTRCPLVTGPAESVHEVARGRARRVVDPSPEALAEALRRTVLAGDPGYDLAEAEAAAREATWRRCAEQTLAAYRRCAG